MNHLLFHILILRATSAASSEVCRDHKADPNAEQPARNSVPCLDEPVDVMSALQAPLLEQAMLEHSATIEKVASDEASEVVAFTEEAAESAESAEAEKSEEGGAFGPGLHVGPGSTRPRFYHPHHAIPASHPVAVEVSPTAETQQSSSDIPAAVLTSPSELPMAAKPPKVSIDVPAAAEAITSDVPAAVKSPEPPAEVPTAVKAQMSTSDVPAAVKSPEPPADAPAAVEQQADSAQRTQADADWAWQAVESPKPPSDIPVPVEQQQPSPDLPMADEMREPPPVHWPPKLPLPHAAHEAPSVDPVFQAPIWSHGHGPSAVAYAISEYIHHLLVSNWHAFYVIFAMFSISAGWFCAALHHHAPFFNSTSVPTLSVLAPRALEATEPSVGSSRGVSSLPWRKPADKEKAAESVVSSAQASLTQLVRPWGTRLRDLRAAIGWALAACLCLGFVHWSLGALPGLGVEPGSQSASHSRRRLLEVLGVGLGLLGACISHLRLASEGGHHVAEELLQPLSLRSTDSKGPIRLAAIAGALLFAALLVQGPLLGSEVHNGGKVLNISGFDALIVAAVLATLNETCSLETLVGMAIIRCSSLTVCAFESSGGLSRLELGVGLVACCFLVAATLCARLSARAGASPFALFAFGSQAAALLSAAHCIFGTFDAGLEAQVSGWVVAFGLSLGMCYALGFYCIAKALQYPYTAACNAAWGSNFIVVLSLEALRKSSLFNDALVSTPIAAPRWPLIIGVVGVVLGVCVCADASMPPLSGTKGPGFTLSLFGFRLLGEESDSCTEAGTRRGLFGTKFPTALFGFRLSGEESA